jgi:hypothetical protein
MRHEHFDPITVETAQPGRLDNITNTEQIAERLAEQWPATHRGAAYKKAVRICLAHLRGEKDASAVRKAFIGAAKEADIFVDDGSPS